LDYIIFGMGTGASLVLAGWLLRELGPRIRDRAPREDDVLSASELVVRMAWARFCATCGMALLLCGLLILLVTGVTIILAPADGIGAMAVLAAFGMAVLLMLTWTGLYLRQFGSLGVIRRRGRAETTPAMEAMAEPGLASDAPIGEDTTAEPRGRRARFGARFRRGAPDSEPEVIPADSSAGIPAAETPVDSESTDLVAPESPAEAAAEGASKRLAIDDPLVTSVGLPFLQRHAAATETDGTAGDVPAPVAGVDPGRAALDALRARRMERLAGTSGKS
jgi:hypothetical protein